MPPGVSQLGTADLKQHRRRRRGRGHVVTPRPAYNTSVSRIVLVCSRTDTYRVGQKINLL